MNCTFQFIYKPFLLKMLTDSLSCNSCPYLLPKVLRAGCHELASKAIMVVALFSFFCTFTSTAVAILHFTAFPRILISALHHSPALSSEDIRYTSVGSLSLWFHLKELRVGQLCDRSQGVGNLWHFKGMFFTPTLTGAGEIHVQPLPASSMDGQGVLC